jgi:hypothetical protein
MAVIGRPEMSRCSAWFPINESENEGELDMSHAIHDIGVASQIAAYSDAIEVTPGLRWLLT